MLSTDFFVNPGIHSGNSGLTEPANTGSVAQLRSAIAWLGWQKHSGQSLGQGRDVDPFSWLLSDGKFPGIGLVLLWAVPSVSGPVWQSLSWAELHDCSIQSRVSNTGGAWEGLSQGHFKSQRRLVSNSRRSKMSRTPAVINTHQIIPIQQIMRNQAT